jgi:hypothetical protein
MVRDLNVLRALVFRAWHAAVSCTTGDRAIVTSNHRHSRSKRKIYRRRLFIVSGG